MSRRVSLFCLAAGAVFGGLLIMGAGCGDLEASTASPAADTLPGAEPIFDVRAVTLDARNPPDSSLLVRLRDLGVTHLTLVSFGWQRAVDEPRVRIDTSEGWYSESHRGIRTLARQADTLGMGIILKPHLWVGGYDEGQDRSEIGFESAARWRKWEADYRRFLMVYARLAAHIDADGLVLGTELTRSATERPAFWRGLAEEVRTVYDGALTYAANWHEAYGRIQFWGALDYVGVQAYFPLTDVESPSLSTLRDAWRPHQMALARVHERTNRPILLTEVGYRSAEGAAEAPWTWPERDEEAVPDSALQARCYRAFLSTVGRAPWLTGGVIWKWQPPSEVEGPTAFTPQGKPAEAVLRRWFTGETPSSASDAP